MNKQRCYFRVRYTAVAPLFKSMLINRDFVLKMLGFKAFLTQNQPETAFTLFFTLLHIRHAK